ncbi:MAG: transcriptional initiation protein Tat, partial [Phycisphaerae bacterium]|nr:transcriptional initiation protein Tat [Phycisphaerae bacterium]
MNRGLGLILMAGLAALSSWLWESRLCAAPGPATEARDVALMPTSRRNSYYICNRAPLLPSAVLRLPYGAVKVGGWVHNMLVIESHGMEGHMDQVKNGNDVVDGPANWCNYDKTAWTHPGSMSTNGWEELPYWLRGYVPMAFLLKNKRMMADATHWVKGVMSTEQSDGYFGPARLKTIHNGLPDLWPDQIMLEVLQEYYDATGDKRVLALETRYFHYLETLPPHLFNLGWAAVRWSEGIHDIYWLYNRTGDKSLLKLVRTINAHSLKWTVGATVYHGVNFGEGFREPAEYYQLSHNPRDLQTTRNDWKTVFSVYGQVPGGGYGADEVTRIGYYGPRQGIETCAVVENMRSDDVLTGISGNPFWADRCDRLAMNTLPAAATSTMGALHYLTAPNQIQLDPGNKAPDVNDSGTEFSYSAGPVYRCCEHNFSQGWPYYNEFVWLGTSDDGLLANFYSDSSVRAKVGSRGQTVRISESTRYPFGQTVKFIIKARHSTRFPLYVRVPDWCVGAVAEINSKPLMVRATPCSYLRITRRWKTGDVLSLTLHMHVLVHRWTSNPQARDAVSVSYGPLAFSLKIREKWTMYPGVSLWPHWSVYPASPWNYGLLLNPKNPAASFAVVRKAGSVPGQPWTQATVPLELKVRARQIPGWKINKLGMIGQIHESPVVSHQPTHTITLIPMGAARLRVSMFPVIGAGASAHRWRVHPPAAIAQASWCDPGDSVAAMVDGITPGTSADLDVPRFTWFPHRGTREWAQLTFSRGRAVSL